MKIHINRGDTFSYAFLGLDIAGNPLDLTRTDVAADLVAIDGEFIDSLRVERTDEASVFLLVADYEQTEQWPVGDALCDIQTTCDGIRQSTKIIQINITRDITRTRTVGTSS